MAALRTTKLTRVFFYNLIACTTLAFVLLGLLWVVWEYKRFDRMTVRMRAEFMANQKERIKSEVDNIVAYIEFKKSQTETRLKREIRNRTSEAWQIATHLYAQYRDTLPEAAVKTMVRNALRPIRFNNGRGYFFAVDLDGVEQLYPTRPELEGQNLIDLQDAEGTYVIRHELEIVRTAGEGFVVDYWPKPDVAPSKAFPKISFVKYVAPLGWYIGTGDYLDDVEKDIQQEVLVWLNSIRSGQEDYVFAGRWDGVSLSGPAVGKNMLDVKDANGIPVVRKLIAAAKAGGGFVRYVMPAIQGRRNAPKISYAAGVPDWQWYVGAGLYADAADRLIADQRRLMRQQLRSEVVKIVLALISLLVLVSLAARFLSSKVDKSLRTLTAFFDKAAGEAVRIEPEELTFTEFAALAESANAMVDQRRQAEGASRESREQLRALVNNALLGIYQVTVDGKLIFANPRMATILGYDSPEDLMAQVADISQLYVDPQDRQNNLQDLFDRGFIADRRMRFLRKDGQIIWVQVSARVAAEIPDRQVLEGFLLDITEQVHSEDALKESETRYRSLVEMSPEAVLLHIKGQIVYINPQGARLLGAESPSEIIGKGVLEIVHPDYQEILRQRLEDVAAKGEPVPPMEQHYCRLDGQTIMVEATGTRIVYAGATAVLSILRDITADKKAEQERRELESKFQQAQKMEAIGTLAGGIAHDFNNLLTGIRGRISLMLEDIEADHPYKEHLREVEAYVRSAADLTHQLLGYARGGKYEIRPVDLNALVQQSAEMFGRTHKEIKIQMAAPKDLWVVEADRTQIEQVLLNLYVNAWQAMEGPGELHLATENAVLDEAFVRPYDLKPGPYVKISVRDTGSGMDAETQRRIFEPFFTTKEISRGTGLGLAAAYGIVSGHAGIITVASEPGEGTTFTIFLPASGKAVPPEKIAPSEIVTGSGRILLVDDEKLIRDLGRVMLARLGYEVLTAEDGPHGLQTFEERQDQIKLVILDMIMPGMGGGEVFDRLRAIDPSVKVLLSSGYSLDGQAAAIMQRGCNGFVQKPFDLGELSRKISAILSPGE
jgi:two-component system cell cycle sensor histidine kinase/response regulator CckA